MVFFNTESKMPNNEGVQEMVFIITVKEKQQKNYKTIMCNILFK